jgi:hypothetical protein
MFNEYLEGLEVLNELIGEELSREMRALMKQYYITKTYYKINALLFEGFFGIDDDAMIECLREANINELYVTDHSTALMYTIQTLIKNGFTMVGAEKILSKRYRSNELEPALKFIKLIK